MAGFLGLTSQTLGSTTSFNWTWFIELVTSGILVVWFIFYLNRLFATAVSYGIRTYTWHKFRVYIDIQSLQISLLGGRIFFKDISYFGENETVLIHNGHLTWRYWLPVTRQNDLTSQTRKPEDDSSSVYSDSEDERSEPATVSRGPESRIGISVNGLEWFIYNRTPVYDAIVKEVGARASSVSTDAAHPTRSFATSVAHKFKIHHRGKPKPENNAKDSSDFEDDADASMEGLERKDSARDTDGRDSTNDDQQSNQSDEPTYEDAMVSWLHSFVLRFLPVDIDCSRGAISLGNEHTRALIVTTFDKAQGVIGAAASGPADIYRQTFDFDVEHPVVQMKPNPDYNLPQMASAERIIAGTEAVLKRHPWYKPHLRLRKKRRALVAGLRNLVPGFRKSVEALHAHKLPSHDSATYVPFDQAQPDIAEWHGLDRYMDELEGDDHQAWTNIEYARFSTLLDAPSVRVLFFWDTPGTVLEDHLPPIASGLTKDANGIEPPGYGLHIDVYGALVHYGPWADRMRAELQGIFLPASYKNVVPRPPLQVGDMRESSLMTISVKIHEEVTLRVPSRETSKDWRWRGRATAVRDAAAMKRQEHKKHFRFRRNAKRRLGPDIRPFGWLAVSVGSGSTVHYVMDMFPGKDGFRNELNLKLKSTKATSSINHATLWSCKEQVVSADLSNPLGWNDLHTWHFSIINKHMDMFLLRDHTFLLLDLITDFTIGLKADYMTFVPFEYIIDIDFDHFNLMLNANDCNIIDNPCDLDSNAFLTLAFESLSGQVGVPMKYFCAPQNSVRFKGSGQNASLLLKTPIWNSLRTFSPDETMATLKSLQLDGEYTYLATVSPGSTESLVMNILGGHPRFNLQGFLIRYFMNVKENYFGDHIHFRTLEEYQSRLDGDGRYLGEELQPPPKKQNDLDVILSVRADHSCAVMPANIYDRSDNLRVDVMLAEADMRFTNHYMDLQVNSSPIEVSLETQTRKGGKDSKDVTRCQLFIDSLAAYGHRLFGSPPTEPAYVCNWDFDIGQISGECSTDFLRILIGAIISFIFTMDDDENALPDTNAVTIPDVTFLRVRTSDLQLWLVTADTAFLVELSPATVNLNDWANQYFSKSLKISAPKVTIAALESQAAYRQRDLVEQNVPTYACVSTSAKVAVLNRKAGFTERRLMQQEHVRTQDLRTNRSPWLLDPSVKLPTIQQQHLAWASEAPAMPIPNMPEPLDAPVQSVLPSVHEGARQLRAQHSSFLQSTSVGSRPPLNKAIPSTTALSNPNAENQFPFPKRRSSTTLDRNTGFRSRSSAAFASNLTLSSAWTKPQFPLHNTKPDLKYMPKKEEVGHYMRGQQDFNVWPDEPFEQEDEDIKHDGIFCKLPDGILGFCTPQLSSAVINLLNEISPHSPSSILDDIQRRTVSNIKVLSSDEPGNIDDMAFKVPFGLIRMVCQHDLSHGSDGYDQYEVSLAKARATVRLKPYVQAGQRRKHVLTHLSVAEITANVAESLPSQQQFLSAAQLSLGDIGLWLGLGAQIRVRSQIGLVEVASAGRNVTSIAGLVQRTQAMVQNVIREAQGFQLFSNEQHFVYHLTLQHKAMDPAFLNRPAYVLRTARSHVRLNDSWKIISRLRNNWITMRDSQAHADICEENCQLHESQDESKRHILSAFNQWKAWEATNLDDSAVVQAIFGLNKQQHASHDEFLDTEVELLLGRLTLTLDPGPRQTQLALQNIDLNVGDKTVLAHNSGWSFQKQFKRQQTVQLYCGNAAIHVDWEVLEFANRLIEILPVDSAPEKPQQLHTNLNVGPRNDSDLTIIVGADLVSLSAKTPNLSLLIGAEIFRASFLIRETAYRQHELTVMLSSSAGRLRLYGLKRSLLGVKITLPNVYVGYKQGHQQSKSSSSVHVAATSRQLRLHLKRDVLQLLKVADALISNEIPDFKTLLDSVPKQNRAGQQQRQDASIRLPQLHMAMFLNNYRMELAILPYLRYVISGKTARTSIVPHDSSRLSIHVDLKENEHAFTNHRNRSQDYKSFLAMPPVNLKLTVKLDPDEVLLDSHGTLELIRLEASAVKACFDAVYKPQTTEYMQEVKSRIRAIQSTVKAQFKSEAPAQLETKASTVSSNKKVRYRIQAVVAGVAIHCTAPPLREHQKYGSDLRLSIGPTSLRLHNEQPESRKLYKNPQFIFVLSEFSLGVFQASQQQINFGLFKMGLSISGRTEMDKEQNEVQHYRAVSDSIGLDLYAETALLMVDIITFLQDRIKNLAISEDAKKMRPLRRLTLAVAESKMASADDGSFQQNAKIQTAYDDGGLESSLFDSTFALDLSTICFRWFVSDHAIHASEEAAESMAFTIRKIDLQTKREGSARLAIRDLQLQLVPSGRHDPMQRSANSALLPEMIFNAAYMKTNKTRKLAFKAAGNAVNVMLAADFILPASAVQRSLAQASGELRCLKLSMAESNTETSSQQLPKLLSSKRLASLLIFADFAGAEVTISQKQEESPSSAFGLLKGSRRSRAGRYGQAVQSGSNQEATLRAPGIALRISYLDNGYDDPSLSTELKVAASSNTLAPSVVPLIQEISSSISEIMGQDNSAAERSSRQVSVASAQTAAPNGLDMGDPTAILGRVKLNGGLWVQQQEFSLTCQPIARVSATAKFDEIFVTINTVQGSDHDRFFSVMTTFKNLSASVQHVYSRESTASFHVDSIVMSFMNSKHFSNKSGISAILEISPMKADLNAKQMQDFMLFREIWYPAELRVSSKTPDTTVNTGAQGQAALQRYQLTANASLPWHAIISVQELRLTIDFGQSIGNSSFIVSKLWASSQKNSDSEQNLCIGFQRIGIESTGRMSGFVELQGFRVRTAIRWPAEEMRTQTPLVQGSIGFEHLRALAAFDYQPFTVADISSFQFLMYNVRQGSNSDRLVGILDGGKIQVFCTTSAAAQALSIFQAFERLVQEKQEAYEASLHELDRYLRRKSVMPTTVAVTTNNDEKPATPSRSNHAPNLQVDVVIMLRAIDAGVFPNTFVDDTTLKLEAVDVQARFAVGDSMNKTHSGLGMSLGQVRVALSSTSKPAANAIREVSIDEVIERATTARGGTILKVPRLVASMETWQQAQSNIIEYIFSSTFQGKVDVGWNYSRISAIRRMWELHSKAFAHRLGKPLPPSAVKITAEAKDDGTGRPGQEKITAVINMPQSKYDYVALEPPIIDTPQLRDLGDATPSLEWIGLHRDRLPHVTHSVIIVSLLELAKEVEDSYGRILGAN